VVATKRKKAPAPVPKARALTEKQEAILGTLDRETKKNVQQVQRWFAREDRLTLKSRYELGLVVQELYIDLTGDGTGHSGYRFVAGLCEAFGWDKGVVYNARNFVRAYTEGEITALADEPMANGRLIPYGHLRALAKLPQKEDRDRLLERAKAGSWTRAELQDAIFELTTGGKREGEDGRGRPLQPPKDLRGVLRQQERSAQEFVQRATRVWEEPPYSLMGNVKKFQRADITDEQIQKLREHAATLRELAAKASEQAAEADRAVEYLVKRLPRPKGGEAASATAATASPDAEQPRPESA
jgi:hypothetical protein